MLDHQTRPDNRLGVNLTKHGGPTLGPLRLLRKTQSGFVPRPAEELSAILRLGSGHPFDFASREGVLKVLADALNKDDWTKAAVALAHLRLPNLPDEEFANRLEAADTLWKANFDPLEPRDECGRWTCEGDRTSGAETYGQIINVLGVDCSQVLAACRVECTDAYVAGDFSGSHKMRRRIRACMNRNGCFDF
jgi:hypothetical protein